MLGGPIPLLVSSGTHSHPLAAKLIVSPAPTMMWSSTRTSMSARASCNRLVMVRSAALGSVTPEGWLWLRMQAAALCRRADRTTSRGLLLAQAKRLTPFVSTRNR